MWRRQMLGQRADGELEFLFIDGGSTDGTAPSSRQLAPRPARAAAAQPGARHSGRAQHRPARRARPLRRPHGRPHPLRARLRRARGSSACAAATSSTSAARSCRAATTPARRWSCARSAAGSASAAPRSARATEEIEVDSGFLGVWERERLLALGGWDEGQVRNQDGELAARLRADGGRIVCIPEMAAWYLPRNSLRGIARQYFGYGRYRARTSVKHPALRAAGARAAARPGGDGGVAPVLAPRARSACSSTSAAIVAEAAAPARPRASPPCSRRCTWPGASGSWWGCAQFHDACPQQLSHRAPGALDGVLALDEPAARLGALAPPARDARRRARARRRGSAASPGIASRQVASSRSSSGMPDSAVPTAGRPGRQRLEQHVRAGPPGAPLAPTMLGSTARSASRSALGDLVLAEHAEEAHAVGDPELGRPAPPAAAAAARRRRGRRGCARAVASASNRHRVPLLLLERRDAQRAHRALGRAAAAGRGRNVSRSIP